MKRHGVDGDAMETSDGASHFEGAIATGETRKMETMLPEVPMNTVTNGSRTAGPGLSRKLPGDIVYRNFPGGSPTCSGEACPCPGTINAIARGDDSSGRGKVRTVIMPGPWQRDGTGAKATLHAHRREREK